MYFTERVISLTCFFIVMVIMCYLISHMKENQYKVILVLYIGILGIFAWNFISPDFYDLTRLKIYILKWVNMSFDEVIDYAFTRPDPSWVFFAYFCNFFDDDNFLQTSSCVLGASFLFSVYSKLIKKFKVHECDRGWLVFFGLASGSLFMGLISGIRSTLATLIVFYCIYNEYFEKRNIIYNLPLYLVAAGFHPFAFSLIIVRILFLSIQTSKSLVRRAFFIILSISLIGLCFYYGQFFIESALDKGVSYSTDSQGYFYIWDGIISFIGIFLNFLLLYWYYKYNKKVNLSLYNSYSIYVFFMSIGSLMTIPLSFTIFVRLAHYAMLLSIPLFSYIFNSITRTIINDDYKIKFFVKLLTILLCIIGFTRGSIYAYKFFIL